MRRAERRKKILHARVSKEAIKWCNPLSSGKPSQCVRRKNVELVGKLNVVECP